MTSRAPIPSHVSKQGVHAFAEKVASELSFLPGAAIEPLVISLGGRIRYKSPIGFEAHAPESITVEAEGKFEISVSSLTSIERARFTIAHELGHYFVHFPVVTKSFPGSMMVATRWVDEGDELQRRAEWEANWFAAGFLMPEHSFREVFGSNPNEIQAVAAAFGVSAHAATVRAISLRLLS